MRTPPSLLSRPVPVATIPAEGTARSLAATPAELAAIAAEFGLTALSSLSAELTLARGRKDRVTVEGRVQGALTQACVVTLEPVEQIVDETFAVRLVPEGDDEMPRPGEEVVVDPAGEDPPDVYAGGVIDVGAIVLEHFALGIDPYPRAPGAELMVGKAEDDARPDSPFAALAALRRGESR